MRLWVPIRDQGTHHCHALGDAARATAVGFLTLLKLPVHLMLLLLTPVYSPALACISLYRDSRNSAEIVRRIRSGCRIARVQAMARKRAYVFPRARAYRSILRAIEHRRRLQVRRLRNSGPPER